MSLEMLQHIARQRLPLTLAVAADIDKVRVLQAADLVVALFVKAPVAHSTERVQTAQVLALTPAGRAALAARARWHQSREAPE